MEKEELLETEVDNFEAVLELPLILSKKIVEGCHSLKEIPITSKEYSTCINNLIVSMDYFVKLISERKPKKPETKTEKTEKINQKTQKNN